MKARSPDQFPNAQRLCPAGYILRASDCPGQQRRPEHFVNVTDRKYLETYAIESIADLIAREHLNRFDNYMQNQIEGRSERAQMIDMLFAVASNLKIEDKQIVY